MKQEKFWTIADMARQSNVLIHQVNFAIDSLKLECDNTAGRCRVFFEPKAKKILEEVKRIQQKHEKQGLVK